MQRSGSRMDRRAVLWANRFSRLRKRSPATICLLPIVIVLIAAVDRSFVRLVCADNSHALSTTQWTQQPHDLKQGQQWLDPMLSIPNPFTTSELEMFLSANKHRIDDAKTQYERVRSRIGGSSDQVDVSEDDAQNDPFEADDSSVSPADIREIQTTTEDEEPTTTIEQIVTVHAPKKISSEEEEEDTPPSISVTTHIVKLPHFAASSSHDASQAALTAAEATNTAFSAGTAPVLNAVGSPCAAARLSQTPVHFKIHAARSDVTDALGDDVDLHGEVAITPPNGADTYFKTGCSGRLQLDHFYIKHAPVFLHAFLSPIPSTLYAQLESLSDDADAIVTFPAGWRPSGPAISQALGNHENDSALYHLPNGWAPGPYDGIVFYSVHAKQILGVGIPRNAADATWSIVRQGGGRWDSHSANWRWPNGISGFLPSQDTTPIVPAASLAPEPAQEIEHVVEENVWIDPSTTVPAAHLVSADAEPVYAPAAAITPQGQIDENYRTFPQKQQRQSLPRSAGLATLRQRPAEHSGVSSLSFFRFTGVTMAAASMLLMLLLSA